MGSCLRAQDASRFERSQRQTIAGSSPPIVAGNYAYFGYADTCDLRKFTLCSRLFRGPVVFRVNRLNFELSFIV